MTCAAVAFVNMPFFPSDRPSLGLSLLKGGLARRGIESCIHYLNIWFAEKCGIEIARELNDFPRVDLVGEWVFAESVWGRDPSNDAAYLADVIEKRAAEHRIYPAPVPPQAMKDKLLFCRSLVNGFLDRCLSEIPWDQYRIVGFSSLFHQQLASLALALRLKEVLPRLVIVFGGANCMGVMGASLFRNLNAIDALFMGEADEVFPEFATEYLSSGRVSRRPGVLVRNGGKRQRACPRIVQCMDGLPDPDFDDFFRQRVHRSNLEKEDLLIMMETSRGCWWGEKSHCLFCGVNDSIMRFRTKSPDRMIGEIDRLVARYGEYSRYLVTTDCCLPPEHLRSTIPRLAEKGLGVRLFYETKVNLKKDQVKVMRQAGIQEMQPGIESLSTPILKKIGKGQTALQSVQLLKWCAEFGIVPNWNYIYGYPGEQPEDYDRGLHILRAITHLQPPLKEGRVRFDRFSPYQTDPHRFGIRALEPYPSYRFVFSGLDSQSISDLAYYFVAEFDGEGRIAEWSREIENIVSLWKKNADQSALFFIDDNSKLLICDFRPGAADPFLVLQGHQRTLYKACDRIRSRSVLLGILAAESGKDLNDTEIDALLKPLLDRRIMLEEEGCCLALAVSLDHEYFPPVELWGVFPDVLARWDEMKAAKT